MCLLIGVLTIFLVELVGKSNNVVAPATVEEWHFHTFCTIIIIHHLNHNYEQFSDGRRRAAALRFE